MVILWVCFVSPCFVLLVNPSSLAKLNQQRRLVKEVPLTENHPFIYTLKNKSSWKIKGKSFSVICHFSAMILHFRNILMDMLASWSRYFPNEKVADTGNLGRFMLETIARCCKYKGFVLNHWIERQMTKDLYAGALGFVYCVCGWL